LACPKRMRSSGINGEGELRGQLPNPGSPGKMAVIIECVCVCLTTVLTASSRQITHENHLLYKTFKD